MSLAIAPLQLLAWLATYLVHSTLLLALAWLVTRRVAGLSLASRERWWKLAVAGGFLTATLQVGLGLEPPLGRLALRGEEPAVVAASPEPPQEAIEAARTVAPPPSVASEGSTSASSVQVSTSPATLDSTALRESRPRPTPTNESARPSDVRVEVRVTPAETLPAPRDPVALTTDAHATDARAEEAPTLPTAVLWPARACLDVALYSASLATVPGPRPVAERTPSVSEERDDRAASPVASAPSATIQLAPRPATAREALRATVPGRWSLGALAGWALTGVLGVLGVLLGLRRLRRELAARVELADGALVDEVDRLRLRAGVARRVRVFVAPRLAAPLSMGWLRPAICVPPRALSELEPEERSAMLAHEVAHLARRDPLWLFGLWAAETLCFFQPLNRLARRELAATFELAADAWAARATGQRLALASCLARIAGWIVDGPPPRAHRAWSAAMADSLDARRPRSRLGQRIERLLEVDEPLEAPRARRVESALGLALLSGLALLAPGASAALAPTTRDVPAPPPPPSVGAPTAPAATSASVVVATAGAAVPDAPAPAPPVATAEGSLAGLDTELTELEDEIAALRADLAETGLEERFAPLLGELQRRVQHLSERRARIATLLERALALEAAARTRSTSR